MNTVTKLVKARTIYEVTHNGNFIGTTENLLTDGYFNRLLAKTLGNRIRLMLGSDNTAPAITDVGLGTYINGSMSSAQTEDAEARFIDGTDYVVERSWVVNYSNITFSGTLRELGALFRNTTTAPTNPGTDVDSRALVRDGAGTVTDVNLNVGDSLTVVVRHQTILPSDQAVATVSIGGNSYQMTYEMLGFNSWEPALERSGFNAFSAEVGARVSLAQALFNDPTAATLVAGNGKSVQVSESLSVSGKYFDITYEIALNAAELAAGVEYIQMLWTNSATTSYIKYGLRFSPKITDPAAQTLYFTLRWQMARV